MAINIPQGFRINSKQPVDARLILTKAEMASMLDAKMPDSYFAICSDDKKLYLYDKTRTASTETGKFYIDANTSNVVLRGYYLNGKFYTDSTYQVELEKSANKLYIDISTNNLYICDGNTFSLSTAAATASRLGLVKLYDESGQNTDGTMTQKSITNGVQSIKFNVDLEDEECLILDLPWDDIQGRY